MARANLALVKLVEGRLDLEIKLTTHHGLTLSRLYVTSPIPNLLPSPLHHRGLSPFSLSLPFQRRCAVRRRRHANTIQIPLPTGPRMRASAQMSNTPALGVCIFGTCLASAHAHIAPTLSGPNLISHLSPHTHPSPLLMQNQIGASG